MRRKDRRPLRVLAADDSAVMREMLRVMFELHASQRDSGLPPMELCGTTRDGVGVMEAIERLQPDVLVLDLEMPQMDGRSVLERLRSQAPALPIIICAGSTEHGARATLEALTLGAKDYVTKPLQQRNFAAALDTLMEQLLPRIAALALGCPATAPEDRRHGFQVAASAARRARVEVVVIGASTGGPLALEQMLPLLPQDFAVPVIIVQHMPRLFTGVLAERLDRVCRMQVRQAQSGAALEAGLILLAPGGVPLKVVAAAGAGAVVELHEGPALHSCRPSADYLFRSAAATYGAGTLAVVMTGMGEDGLDGARKVKQAGGVVLAQDEATSAVWGMPGRVVRAGLAASVLPLRSIAAELVARVAAGRGRHGAVETERPDEVRYGVL